MNYSIVIKLSHNGLNQPHFYFFNKYYLNLTLWPLFLFLFLINKTKSTLHNCHGNPCLNLWALVYFSNFLPSGLHDPVQEFVRWRDNLDLPKTHEPGIARWMLLVSLKILIGLDWKCLTTPCSRSVTTTIYFVGGYLIFLYTRKWEVPGAFRIASKTTRMRDESWF